MIVASGCCSSCRLFLRPNTSRSDDVRQGSPHFMDCPHRRSAFGDSYMLPTPHEPGLPLLIVIEGENDIHFLKAISTTLHIAIPDLPDLTQLTAERRAIF